MLTWVLRRVLAVVPVLLGVTLAVFSMLFLVPGDPVKMMLAEFVTTPDQIAQMRAQLHLDEPILKQYGRFVTSAARGALGTSIRSRRPVTTEIGENVWNTAQLALAAMLVAVWGLLTALVLAHMPVGQPSLRIASSLASLPNGSRGRDTYWSRSIVCVGSSARYAAVRSAMGSIAPVRGAEGTCGLRRG